MTTKQQIAVFLSKQSFSKDVKCAMEKKAEEIFDSIPVEFRPPRRSSNAVAAAILYVICRDINPFFVYRFTKKQLADKFQVSTSSIARMSKQIRENKFDVYWRVK